MGPSRRLLHVHSHSIQTRAIVQNFEWIGSVLLEDEVAASQDPGQNPTQTDTEQTEIILGRQPCNFLPASNCIALIYTALQYLCRKQPPRELWPAIMPASVVDKQQ